MRLTRTIRLSLAALALAALTLPALAQRGDDADRKSKNGKTEGTIDGVEVVLEYGRPNVKGRQIWGSLVPYGQVWRTGADEATTFSVSADVTIGGKKLAAGTYALFTLPGEDGWVVIFNKAAEQWGAFGHDAGQDALRVEVTPRALDEPVEAMDFVIEGSAVVLRWEKLAVPFEVAAGS